jgi:hypothetical protein
MALNWYTDACREDLEKLYPPRPRVGPNLVTSALALAMNATSMAQITHGNAAEFYGRLKIYEALVGPIAFAGPGGLSWYKAVDIHNHIGMAINGSTRGRNAWLYSLLEQCHLHFVREYKVFAGTALVRSGGGKP